MAEKDGGRGHEQRQGACGRVDGRKRKDNRALARIFKALRKLILGD